jgi:hypothetical protein
MLNFSFRQWIEASVPPIHDKQGVVKRWVNSMPPESDSPQIDSEVWTFTEAMADARKNATAISWAISARGKHSSQSDVRYGPKRISGNLLLVNSPLLKDAVGIVTLDPSNTQCSFIPDGPPEIIGSLIIALPPFTYSMEDKAILAGVIRHELRHASDFVSMGGKVSGIGYPSKMTMDLDRAAYYSHIVEARAYADQLRWYLRMMGNDSGKVMSALAQSELFGADKELQECAKYFLEEISKSPVSEDAQPVAKHANMAGMSEKTMVNKAVQNLSKIVELFRLKHNIKKS